MLETGPELLHLETECYKANPLRTISLLCLPKIDHPYILSPLDDRSP
jgi:hypothetical protein